jgi:hypothetical protein
LENYDPHPHIKGKVAVWSFNWTRIINPNYLPLFDLICNAPFFKTKKLAHNKFIKWSIQVPFGSGTIKNSIAYAIFNAWY